jgi:hypothetical protein
MFFVFGSSFSKANLYFPCSHFSKQKESSKISINCHTFLSIDFSCSKLSIILSIQSNSFFVFGYFFCIAKNSFSKASFLWSNIVLTRSSAENVVEISFVETQ